jgi:hypothetical protein
VKIFENEVGCLFNGDFLEVYDGTFWTDQEEGELLEVLGKEMLWDRS